MRPCPQLCSVAHYEHFVTLFFWGCKKTVANSSRFRIGLPNYLGHHKSGRQLLILSPYHPTLLYKERNARLSMQNISTPVNREKVTVDYFSRVQTGLFKVVNLPLCVRSRSVEARLNTWSRICLGVARKTVVYSSDRPSVSYFKLFMGHQKGHVPTPSPVPHRSMPMLDFRQLQMVFRISTAILCTCHKAKRA